MNTRVCAILAGTAIALDLMVIGFGWGFTSTLKTEPTAEPTYTQRELVEPPVIAAPVAEAKVLAVKREALIKVQELEPMQLPPVETTTAAEPEEVPEPEATYTEEELEMLALVIYQEAGGDAAADSTRQMVGEVVLNRIADSRYPNTMREVLTQRSQYGRLHWTGLVWPERASKKEEAHAVQRAYDTAEALLSGEAERLLPTDVVFQAEFKQGKEVVVFQDDTYFCR